MVPPRCKRIGILILLLVLMPWSADAAPRVVMIDTTVRTDITQILSGLVDLILVWSAVIATGLFVLGSALMIGSGGTDQYLSAGKRIMKAAIIGFIIVLASWMILSVVVYFVQG